MTSLSKRRFFGFYEGLGKEVELSISFEEMARQLAEQNYGVHRMVCALATALEKKYPDSELAAALYEAANKYTF